MTDPSKLVIEAFDFRLMDIGTSGYTEYETDAELGMFMFENDYVDTIKMGHCHSHHNMQAYFSGTDNDELLTNAPNHNVYLSLIVNNKMENVARIAYVVSSEVEGSVTIRDFDGKELKQTHKVENYVLYLDADIEYIDAEYDFTELDKRIEELKPKPKPVVYSPRYNNQKQSKLFSFDDEKESAKSFTEAAAEYQCKQLISKFVSGDPNSSMSLKEAIRTAALRYPSIDLLETKLTESETTNVHKKAYESVYGKGFRKEEFDVILLQAMVILDELTYNQYHVSVIVNYLEGMIDGKI